MNDEILAKAIIDWANSTFNDSNRWNRNKVGLAIRQAVGKYWKALPRGRTSKAKR